MWLAYDKANNALGFGVTVSIKLDYQAQSRPLISRRTAAIVLAVLAVVTLCVGCWRLLVWQQQVQAARLAAAQAARLANAYCLIDSTIPATEVYLRDKLLGTTPLVLSKEDLLRLGLARPHEEEIEIDLWGEGLEFFDASTNSYPRLMYKVPDNQAAAFLHYQTPWGTRTKSNNGLRFPNGVRRSFMSRGKDGITVDVEFPEIRNPIDTVLKVTVTVTNTGTSAYTGVCPELELHWGTLDVQWEHRFQHYYPLANEWTSLPPGCSRQTTLDLPLPEQSGDYSVFAIFNVLEDEQSQVGIKHGSVYSDSKLLRIR